MFGVGDWLLGYVDPQPVSNVFSVLKSGHGATYGLWKINLTLFLGALGVPLLYAGCTHIAKFVSDKKSRKTMEWSMGLLPIGWLLIHFTVSCGIYVYAWNMQQGDPALALALAEDMERMLSLAQGVGDLFAAFPLILLPIMVLRKKTEFNRISQVFTPLLWMVLLSAVKFIFPATPFTNGIDVFCMNAGMMIWFSYLLFAKP